MATTPNVYEKLQQARVELQATDLKKSGKNTHMKYSYFELSDFLPQVNRIFAERKLCSVVSFTPELATLTVVNSEKPDESITFTSPMASAKLSAAHDIQNLGAVETYQRRYLYMTALEIVEHDALDASKPEESNGKTEAKPAPQRPASYNVQNAANGEPAWDNESPKRQNPPKSEAAPAPSGLLQERLKSFMSEQGMSQKELANAAGVQASTIARIEAGVNGVPEDEAAKLTAFLGGDAPKGKPSPKLEVDKGRKAYFAEAAKHFKGHADTDAAKNFAKWWVSLTFKVEPPVASFNDITLEQLTELYKHVRDNDSSHILNEYEMLKRDYFADTPDEIPDYAEQASLEAVGAR